MLNVLIGHVLVLEAALLSIQKEKATQILKSRVRRANSRLEDPFEETFQTPDFERECLEEVCQRNEFVEATRHFNHKKRAYYWNKFYGACRPGSCIGPGAFCSNKSSNPKIRRGYTEWFNNSIFIF